MLRVVEKPGTRKEEDEGQHLDGLAREGARRMLMKALEAEVASYIEAHEQERDERGWLWWCGTGRHGRES